MARGHRRTDKELFFDKLSALSGNEGKLVSNPTLRDALGWAEDKYNKVRDEFWQEGLLIRGKGRGGTIAVKPAAKRKAIKLFVSYSHKDSDIVGRLLQHLTPLVRLGVIEPWTFRELIPGEEWDKKIKDELKQAEIVVMLVSIDFINSTYITDVELSTAIERHKAGNATVIPVIVRNCIWKTSALGDLQALPSEARAMASWPDIDDACVDVANGIRKIAEGRLSTGVA